MWVVCLKKCNKFLHSVFSVKRYCKCITYMTQHSQYCSVWCHYIILTERNIYTVTWHLLYLKGTSLPVYIQPNIHYLFGHEALWLCSGQLCLVVLRPSVAVSLYLRGGGLGGAPLMFKIASFWKFFNQCWIIILRPSTTQVTKVLHMQHWCST